MYTYVASISNYCRISMRSFGVSDRSFKNLSRLLKKYVLNISKLKIPI